MASFGNRARCLVSGTPGTGSVTIGTAATGFQTFAAAGVLTGDQVRYLLEEGANWEIAEGVYASGVLTRTPMDSSLQTHPATSVSFTSSAVVSLILIADDMDFLFCLAASGK